MLAARHDDDDDDAIFINIQYIHNIHTSSIEKFYGGVSREVVFRVILATLVEGSLKAPFSIATTPFAPLYS